jgi:hypothetical protein
MKSTIIALGFAALAAAGPACAAGKQPIRGGQDLTGTWMVRATVNPDPAIPICPGPTACTYLAASTATSDGTLVQTAAIPATSTGHGVWKRTGSRTFSASALYFRFDAAGQPAGTSISRIQVELADDGRSGHGTFVALLLDLQGDPALTYSGSVAFERLE